MSADKRWRLICYDIRDDKRYRKVFKVLRGTGYSVQYSIFRAQLDDRETEELRWKLARLMAPEDALLIVDLCPRCAANVISRNHVDGWTDEPQPFAIVGPGAPTKASPRIRGPARVRGPEPETGAKLANGNSNDDSNDKSDA